MMGMVVVLFIFGWMPLHWLHLLLDPLASDHYLAPLDQTLFSSLRAGAAGLGFLLLLFAGVLLKRPGRAEPILRWLAIHIIDLWQDNTRLLAKLAAARPVGWEAILLGGIAGVGLFTRLVLLPGPMQYDESVTYIDFASHSLWTAISDYSAPNNHVFHTLLVFFSVHLFGNAPWVVRLPAFLAGALAIPAAYLLGRTLYNRQAGWMAAALVAWWPQLVIYSANARGYSLLGLFTLLNFALAGQAIRRRSPAAWAWIAVFSAAGLFTVPVMAYSLGMLYTWLVFSMLAGETKRAYPGWRFLAWMGACGAVTLGLAGVLYLPVLFTSGPTALFGNPYLASIPLAEFFQRMPLFLGDIWMRFTQSMTRPVILVLWLGLGLSLVFHRRIARHKVPMLPTTLLFFCIVIPIQRPDMISKLFFFSIPLLAVWIAAGWAALLSVFPRRRLGNFISILIVLSLATGCVLQALPNLVYLKGVSDPHEKAAAWLKANLEPEDIVIVDFPTDARVLYYALRDGMSADSFHNLENRSYRRAYILVNPREGQTLEEVITDHPLSVYPLDPSLADELVVIDTIYIYVHFPINPLPHLQVLSQSLLQRTVRDDIADALDPFGILWGITGNGPPEEDRGQVHVFGSPIGSQNTKFGSITGEDDRVHP